MQSTSHDRAEDSDRDVPQAYTERLYAPVSWWLLGLLIVVAIGWAFLVATPLIVTWIATAVALVVVATILVSYGGARITVDDRGVRAGKALLPLANVGAVSRLDRTQTRQTVGPDADARAFLLLRSYCPGAVTIVVDDDHDPTPYWLVSTRHPTALAASLTDRVVQD